MMTNVGSCLVLLLHNALRVLNAAVFSWQSFKCLSVSIRDTRGSVLKQLKCQTHLHTMQTIYSIYGWHASILICHSSHLCVSPVGWEMSLWYETLFIEWSDLFCLHIIHLSPPWQFSLSTGFNIGQNAICIYISFFIRPSPLSTLKTLGIWRKSVAANLK